MIRFPQTALLLCLAVNATQAGEKIGPKLRQALESGASSPLPVWIFFRDKGESLARFTDPEQLVSRRSIERRLKTRSIEAVVDDTDLPLNEEYVSGVRPLLLKIRNRSRWFNAVSAEVFPERINEISMLPYVLRIEKVAPYRHDPDIPVPTTDPGLSSLSKRGSGTRLDYGLSYDQLQQISVIALHDSGYSGEGVMIGVFDNGFRLLEHEAFDSLRIVATYDFVDRKTSVVPNDPASGGHGVNTLSAIGGFRPGELIGAAFRADFVLARTENDSSETPLEEDNWVAAIEWADSIGVDVTSTSLIYREYDPPYSGWTWQHMDGNTTLITRAADMAVAKGIIVVNAAGNFGAVTIPGQNTLGAPADGDSVLAVGAVDGSGNRASFSSMGPTAGLRPRIKPDIAARGVAVRAASSAHPASYIYTGGTSLACPLAAGAAALLIQMFPGSDPVQIMTAMKATAGNAASPDNSLGWGILNAKAAADWLSDPPDETPRVFSLKQNYPNPFNTGTFFTIDLAEPSHIVLEIFNVLGQKVRTLLNETLTAGSHTRMWNGSTSDGKPAPSGVYIYRVRASFGESSYSSERKLVLLR
jgi:hypothetical protein